MIEAIQTQPYYVLLTVNTPHFSADWAEKVMERFSGECGYRKLAIIDLKNAGQIDADSLQTLAQAGSKLPGVKIALIGDWELANQIEEQGLSTKITHFPSLAAITGEETPDNPVTDFSTPPTRSETLSFLSTTVNCTLETLKVISNISVKSYKSTVMKDPSDILDQCVTGACLPLSCRQFDGEMYLLFPEKTYLKIMSGFIGHEYERIDDPIRDGAAELLNILAGDLKNSLDARSYRVNGVVPRLLSPDDIHSDKLRNPSILIEFATDQGPLWIKYVEGGSQHTQTLADTPPIAH